MFPQMYLGNQNEHNPAATLKIKPHKLIAVERRTSCFYLVQEKKKAIKFNVLISCKSGSSANETRRTSKRQHRVMRDKASSERKRWKRSKEHNDDSPKLEIPPECPRDTHTTRAHRRIPITISGSRNFTRCERQTAKRGSQQELFSRVNAPSNRPNMKSIAFA